MDSKDKTSQETSPETSQRGGAGSGKDISIEIEKEKIDLLQSHRLIGSNNDPLSFFYDKEETTLKNRKFKIFGNNEDTDANTLIKQDTLLTRQDTILTNYIQSYDKYYYFLMVFICALIYVTWVLSSDIDHLVVANGSSQLSQWAFPVGNWLSSFQMILMAMIQIFKFSFASGSDVVLKVTSMEVKLASNKMTKQVRKTILSFFQSSAKGLQTFIVLLHMCWAILMFVEIYGFEHEHTFKLTITGDSTASMIAIPVHLGGTAAQYSVTAKEIGFSQQEEKINNYISQLCGIDGFTLLSISSISCQDLTGSTDTSCSSLKQDFSSNEYHLVMPNPAVPTQVTVTLDAQCKSSKFLPYLPMKITVHHWINYRISRRLLDESDESDELASSALLHYIHQTQFSLLSSHVLYFIGWYPFEILYFIFISATVAVAFFIVIIRQVMGFSYYHYQKLARLTKKLSYCNCAQRRE